MSIQILGTGSYVPEKIVTNDDLSKMVETSDEWITQRVGVRERHVSVHESAAEMGAIAAQRALEAAGITADQLGLIVGATVSADYGCPSLSAAIQSTIGASCPAFDVNSACSGFMFALDTAAAFIARGGIRYALVLGAERLSRILDWTDRSTCVIFGDGAGAAHLGDDVAALDGGGGDLGQAPVHDGIGEKGQHKQHRQKEYGGVLDPFTFFDSGFHAAPQSSGD